MGLPVGERASNGDTDESLKSFFTTRISKKKKWCNSRQNFTIPLRVAEKKEPTENGLNVRPRSLHMSVCPDRGPEEGIKYSDPEMGNSTCMSYSIVRSISKLVLLFLTMVGFCVHSLM